MGGWGVGGYRKAQDPSHKPLTSASAQCSTTITKNKSFLPLKICSFNTQDLCSKFAQLREYISNKDADIFVITETWLDSSVLDSEFVPEGFKAFRRDRDIKFCNEGTYTNTRRGGVAILCKEDLNPQEYTKGDTNVEIKWVQINPVPNVHYLIGGCYRTEKYEKKIIQEINKSIYSIDTTNVLLFGDLNFRRIQWDTLTTTNEVEKAFVDTLNDKLLTRVVDEPTRGSNTLDLIISGSPTDIEKWVLCPPFSTRDH